jgi:hypothetical protein
MEVDLQSLFGLHVTCCAQLYSLAETLLQPPESPAFGLVYEGDIGQQRQTTSLCNPQASMYVHLSMLVCQYIDLPIHDILPAGLYNLLYLRTIIHLSPGGRNCRISIYKDLHTSMSPLMKRLHSSSPRAV